MSEKIYLNKKFALGKPPDINISTSSGFFICGGSVRRWFTGEKQNSDIDVFCDKYINEESIKTFMKKNNLTVRTRTDRLIMFNKSNIQLILQPRFDIVEEAISNFDFTVCQFGTTRQFNGIITTPEAIILVLRKHLGINKIQPGYEIDSLRRSYKYYKQGYIPCIGTIRELAKALNNANKEDIAKFNEISPERWD